MSLGSACPDFGGLLWIAGCSSGCGYGYGYGCAFGCACACACGYGCGCLGFVDVAGGVEIPEVLSVSMLDQVYRLRAYLGSGNSVFLGVFTMWVCPGHCCASLVVLWHSKCASWA